MGEHGCSTYQISLKPIDTNPVESQNFKEDSYSTYNIQNTSKLPVQS